MNRFEGKVAVVTGGAKGIGAATARRLASEGAVVYVADVDREHGEKTAADIGGNVHFVHCDVGSSADWAALATEIEGGQGKVDVFVSNAYAIRFGPAHLLDEDDWDRTLEVTLKALYLGIKALTPLAPATGAAVVAVSSVHAHASFPGFAAYAAAKGGVSALARQLAIEYAPGVRVNTVVPGPILTPQWDGVPAESIADESGRTLLGRMGGAEEVAAAVAFLASDEAGFITGAELPVDGGWLIRHR
ncbi:SDR family NAD(P)-dependent oxidoreductase [Glycomyces algeriensis]|uniref:Short-chain dehydrogenase n=1 Tax=Glycomyces algeriensis TaxID=256037 RepID=A0A9W6GAF4_9ACTN|nr:SDR family oxidoreductase [Glycomyces algeriensis]MDA1364571.1 SDR family NAD(P)-dependent oxidoreductase [Glycomyces algeriensis]MDR7350608.1 NAD(P)-dependent dehydrogenase (short-subunit alcohol dehydrogenase family) [Glycomyces algeriensis]GLI43316.1 short-chain dehydrogenase [Glycomyces algeriensis]